MMDVAEKLSESERVYVDVDDDGECEWRTVESTAVSIGVEVAMLTEKTKMKVLVTLLETSSGFVTVATTETCTFPCNSSLTWAKISQPSGI